MAKANSLFRQEGLQRILHPYRGRIALLSVLTVLQSLLQVAMALLTRSVIDAALTRNGQLLFWGVILAADILAMVVFHAVLAWYAGSTADRFCAALRKDILHTALYSRDSKLQAFHSGELLSRGMEDVHAVCDGAINALPALVGQVTRLVATFAAVLLIHPPVAIVLLVAAVVVGAVVTCLRPAIKARHRLVRQTDEQVMSNLQEDLQQLELIQSLGAQEQILKRFGQRLTNNLRAKVKRRIWSVGSNGIINAVSLMGTGTLLLWGTSQVAAGALSYGSLTSMIQLLSLFRGPVLGLSGLWTRLASVEVAAERLQGLLTREEAIKKLPREPKVKAVVFENVTFSYSGDEVPVLQDFNARFSLDGWVCLTGISGKGKSTLFKLMLGLYSPQAGSVYLQTDCGDIICSEETRHLFAYVPQDYALLSGTVMENLQLVAPEADEKQLSQALRVAQADFILEMNSREQTRVGENNTGLSKGQLQRLAIARAILMERPVFLLDECTSALDAETEKAVLHGLRALGKNAILVTHRPEALEGIEGITGISMEE